MTFNELKSHCAMMRVSTAKIADEIGLSYDGLKNCLLNQSLSLRYVLPLCQSLCITPNRFFGVTAPEMSVTTQQIQNGGNGNSQTIGSDIVPYLRQQLKEKDEQIKVKDGQIKILLDIVSQTTINPSDIPGRK